MRKLFFLLLLLTSVNILYAVNTEFPDEKFKQGTELYISGKYQEALEIWLSIYNSGFRSANLNYNIGNAFFKMNDIPHAILFYERALLLKPADEDISYNLQVARTFVVDKFVEVPELFFVTWFNFIALIIPSNTWAIISIISFVLFLSLFSVFLFSSAHRVKAITFWCAIVMFLISGSSLAFSLRNKRLVTDSGKAIIVSPQVNGKSSPDISGTDLFLIHEGTKVTVTDSVGNWYEIRLPDGNKGWVTSNSLEKI
ncbi:MAG: SH3 domain-containing protein [Bacteroidales bacterium]|nr:SH3 domain-containing protein [Bacteroidales bacterium]